MKDTINSTTTRTRTITLNGEDIVSLLGKIDSALKQRKHAEVTFTVPRGGDFSGDVIEVDDEHPITVTFISVEEK